MNTKKKPERLWKIDFLFHIKIEHKKLPNQGEENLFASTLWAPSFTYKAFISSSWHEKWKKRHIKTNIERVWTFIFFRERTAIEKHYEVIRFNEKLESFSGDNIWNQ